MTLSLRNRIWTWSAGSMLALLFVFALVADNSFRSTIVRELETNARTVAQLAEQQHRRRLTDFVASSMLLARDPTLVAAVSTDDSITVRQFLEDVLPMDVDWLAVVRLDGTPFAATYGATLEPLRAAENFLLDARYYDGGDVWVDEEGLRHMAAGPILRDDLPLAILVASRKLDSSTALGLEALLQQRVALLAGDHVVATDSSTAEALLEAGLAHSETAAPGVAGRTRDAGRDGDTLADVDEPLNRPSLPPMAEVQTFFLGGEEFLGLTASIVNANSDQVANILAFRSLDTALQPARELRLTLLAVASAGVAVAFLLGLVLARTVTAPVNRLIEDAQRLGSGDLNRPIMASRPDEIGHLAEGFDRMRVSLKKAQEELVRGERLSAIGQMASSLVHDFSNPLVSIRLNADVLEMDELSSDNRRAVGGIKASVERLNQMMRELLDFVSGKVSIDRKNVQVGPWLDDIERFWTANLATMSVTFRLEAGYREGWAFDAARLRRVVDNLVKNAQSVVRPGGSITVRTARDPNGLRLEVQDTGPGVPPELRETLFQPFVTFGKKEGTGLGLAICKNLVDRHGGVIDFTSTSGGTTFTIVIPWVPARELQEATT